MTIEVIFCPEPRIYMNGYLASPEDVTWEYPEHVGVVLHALASGQSLRLEVLPCA